MMKFLPLGPLLTLIGGLLLSQSGSCGGQEPSLFEVLGQSNCTEIQSFRDHGASVSARDGIGATPLMRTLEKGLPIECVRALLDAGADPNATHGPLEISALMVAASYSSAEVVSLLLESGANVSFATPDGWTALMSAARNSSRPGVIRALVAAGAIVNALDQYGATPLMRAAQSNPNPAIIETLLLLGADLTQKNPEGHTAYELAKGVGRDRVVLGLLEPKPDREAKGSE